MTFPTETGTISPCTSNARTAARWTGCAPGPIGLRSSISTREYSQDHMENLDQPKQLKTAAELEALILADLLNVDGCPQQGVRAYRLRHSLEGDADVRRRSRTGAQ